MRILFLLLLLISWNSKGNTSLELNILPIPHAIISGVVNDGKIIAKGKIIYSGEKRGFKIWSEQPFVNGGYKSIDRNESYNSINYTINADGVSIKKTIDGGFEVFPTDSNVSFNIIINGEQELKTGVYTIDLNVSPI